MNVKKLCLLALLCGLSALGAQFRIYGSIALDTLPAFLAAFLLGGLPGAVAGAAGHLLSALLAGFPLTLPLHFVVAAEMGVLCYFAGRIALRHPLWLASLLAFSLNAFISPLILLIWPGMGVPVFIVLLPGLVLGSAINAFGAASVAGALLKYGKVLRGWHL